MITRWYLSTITLKTQTINAISYSFGLLSFVFQNPEAKKIKGIYLFGSAIRGELHSKSDIDLFVECKKEDEKQVEQVVNSGIVKFESSKDYQKWKLFKFTYPFAVNFGRLDEWDLKLSIASEGIQIYNRESGVSAGERRVLFTIKYPKKKKDYIKIRRLLFGRDEEYYVGTGLIKSMTGKRISSNVFIIPKEEQTKMREILAKEKIDFSMQEIVVLD